MPFMPSPGSSAGRCLVPCNMGKVPTGPRATLRPWRTLPPRTGYARARINGWEILERSFDGCLHRFRGVGGAGVGSSLSQGTVIHFGPRVIQYDSCARVNHGNIVFGIIGVDQAARAPQPALASSGDS